MVTDNLGMQSRNDETDEESTRRSEAQRADPNGPNRRTQRNDDKQREQGEDEKRPAIAFRVPVTS